MTIPERCHWHKQDRLGYVAFFDDCERREKLGQKQRKCPTCKRWIWNAYWGKKPKGLK